MSTTNSTTNYHLSQYVGSDVTSYLTNYNADMSAIDAQMKANADAASTANTNASSAITTANAAASDASSALSTANDASSTATSAQTAAQEAQTAAGAAQTDAAAALTASEANNIANLAPAYDPTLTYALDDLVTYVDPETHRGALYKNIVPIGTPEAFNVNKWDDVTASACFERKYSAVATVTSDGIKDYSTLLTELAAQFTIDSTKDYELVISNAYGDTRCKVITVVSPTIDATNPRVTFIITGLNSTYGLYGEKYVASQVTGNSAYETYYSTGTYQGHHNNSTTVVPNGTTFAIYSNN